MPGLVLGFFEVTVLTAISVAISTRLPMLANLVVCILIFFLGHLSPVLVEVAEQSSGERARRVHGAAFRVGASLARVLQRRTIDFNRRRHTRGTTTSCLHSAIACCTVEQRCYWLSSSLKTATWLDRP